MLREPLTGTETGPPDAGSDTGHDQRSNVSGVFCVCVPLTTTLLPGVIVPADRTSPVICARSRSVTAAALVMVPVRLSTPMLVRDVEALPLFATAPDATP